MVDEAIWRDSRVVGFVTSGGYAPFIEKFVALGFISTQMGANGAAFV